MTVKNIGIWMYASAMPSYISYFQKKRWSRQDSVQHAVGRPADYRIDHVPPFTQAAPQREPQESVALMNTKNSFTRNRQGKESVVFTMIERIARTLYCHKIPGRNSAGVNQAMTTQLHEQYGDQFAQVFKTITTDNGPHLRTSPMLNPGVQRFTLHIHTRSLEWPHNERHKGMLCDSKRRIH